MALTAEGFFAPASPVHFQCVVMKGELMAVGLCFIIIPGGITGLQHAPGRPDAKLPEKIQCGLGVLIYIKIAVMRDG
ncbi:hypothetical protein D3C73_1508760 [compost metagenome]